MSDLPMTPEQLARGMANVSEGLCPRGHGRLVAERYGDVGWCRECSEMAGRGVAFAATSNANGIPGWFETAETGARATLSEYGSLTTVGLVLLRQPSL